MQVLRKSMMAEVLGVSRGRLSQYIKAGLPVEPNGTIDEAKARRWIADNVDPVRSFAARQTRDASDRKVLAPEKVLTAEWFIVHAQRFTFLIARDHGLSLDLARDIASYVCLTLWVFTEQELGLPEDSLKIESKFLELPEDYVPSPPLPVAEEGQGQDPAAPGRAAPPP